MTKHWTESELEYIRANYLAKSLADMGFHLHVAASTVRNKMLSMGLKTVPYRRNRHEWSSEEIDYLKENYPHSTAIDIAEKLGMSDTSVSNKAKELGLVKSPEWRKSQYHRRYVNCYSGNDMFRKFLV